MPIYEITANRLRRIEETSFHAAGVRERSDLQRLLRGQIDVISPDTLIVTEEFGDWEDSRRRIDLLGLDKDANLVVFELKRTQDGGHMELQAIRYAAMVSTMTFEQVVEVHEAYLRRSGSDADARAAILDFLEWWEPDEDHFAQDVRIVLVSAEFSKEITTAVMWLNERGLDIRCIRIKPYQDNGRVLVDVQQVIPLPEAQEYQVKIREKETRERTARREHTELQELCRRFWTGLLAKARERTALHAGISPSSTWYVAASAGRSGFRFVYVLGQTCPRVELYIDTGDQGTNKRLFDAIQAQRADIETRFGGPLGWERLDGKKACRIRFDLSPSSVKDEANWASRQDELIDAMIRFERALRPHIDALAG